jgi:chromosome segregation ATPase
MRSNISTSRFVVIEMRRQGGGRVIIPGFIVLTGGSVMFRQRLFRTVGGVAVVLIGIVAVVAGQAARPATPATKASLDDLVAEVRDLRAEINQAAGASIRAQLFVARLQLQEQRVNAVARQLADVQSRLASVQQGQAVMRERLTATEEGQARLPPEDRSDNEIHALTLQLEQGQTSEQELRAQESALSGAAIAEQSRWTDFSNRLDALERSLPAAAPR